MPSWGLPSTPLVLYVSHQRMLRFGAVIVDHVGLMLERFGRFWSAFHVIDLCPLTALTVATGCVTQPAASRAQRDSSMTERA